MDNIKENVANLVILRGLPGAGKTTFAKHCFIGYDYCDADMFINPNAPFDGENLKNAHEQCLYHVKQNLLGEFDTIVGNTFTRNWEMQPYVDTARELGVNLFVAIVENSHGNESVHDGPEKTMNKMKARFEDFKS